MLPELNPYLPKEPKRLPQDSKTTGYGVIGEGIQGLAWFLPPPFNFVALGVGIAVKSIAWYMAADRPTAGNALNGPTSHE